MHDKSEPQRKRSGYRQLIGYRTKEWREGYGEVELVVGEQHLNTIGIVHGGVYVSLLDVALGHAVSYCTVPGNFRFSTTVSLSTNFLKGTKSGVLTAIGRVDGVEGRMATGSGEVWDEAVSCAQWRRRASSTSPEASGPRAFLGASDSPRAVERTQAASCGRLVQAQIELEVIPVLRAGAESTLGFC